jgi:hypothetical protein
LTKKLNGYLDHLRENLETLNEQITNARKMSRLKGKADKAIALQYAKTLRDLVELRETTLGNIKVHLLGRDETGAPNEPDNIWDDNAQIEFERWFKGQVSPWVESDLKLTCEDCGVESEEVSHRDFREIKDSHWNTLVEAEDVDLCLQCVEKRKVARQERAGSSETKETAEPASKRDIETLAQTARLLIKALDALPVEQRIAELERMLAEKVQVAPGMEPACEAYVGVLRKALDDARAELRGGCEANA